MLAKNLQGAAAAAVPAYIEDVFSTYLYTGNGSSQTITNGIDLAGKGGLVWIKDRGNNGASHWLTDTQIGRASYLSTNNTNAALTDISPGYAVSSFNSAGFSLGPSSGASVNTNGWNYASWTFREQAKFFDVVTWTGNGSNRTIAHNLGSVPGCIIVKRTDSASNWSVYHRGFSSPSTQYGILNNYLGTPTTDTTFWNSTAPTSTVFSVGTNAAVNDSGGTYVAYLFAHNAGGFGASGSDNVISCGSFTTDGSGNATVNLGYEPQWVMIKDLGDNQYYAMYDNMRGLTSTVSGSRQLFASTSDPEGNNPVLAINATGFFINQYASVGYIYIAIRRGPMKTPTSGTSVFSPVTYVGNNTARTITSGFPVDLSMTKIREAALGTYVFDRLRGPNLFLETQATTSETSRSDMVTAFPQNGVTLGADTFYNGVNQTGFNYVDWTFRRAPGFFDVVCYTGTGSARTVNHNLGAVPELMIIKDRTSTNAWSVNAAILGTSGNILNLATTGAAITSSTPYNSTAPTSTVFTVGTAGGTNSSGLNYVAYLFATVAGVSKVGSYTGNGSNQTINCGFTGGARFILIKRTDSTGDWYVWDTARGIVSGNDPYLLLNSTAAEVTTDDSVDTDSSGFIVNQLSATNINVNSATYIFFAVS